MEAAAAAWRGIVEALDLSPRLVQGTDNFSTSQDDWENQRALFLYVESATLVDFLDLLSALYYGATANQRRGAWATLDPDDFRNMLNERLARHYSAFRMSESGAMEEPGAELTEAAVEKARGILRDPRFAGPDRQFQDAVLDFHRAPEPNYEGAVSGAVNAVEGMVRIVLGDKDIPLGKGLIALTARFSTHPAVVKSLGGVHGFASDVGGRHGLVGDPKVDRELAQYVVHLAAAAILLLASYADDTPKLRAPDGR